MTGRDEASRPVDRDHLSLEQLADLADAVPPASASAAARAHVDGCAVCRGELDALANVTTLLAASADVPMPADVAARFDVLFAEEARRRDEPTPLPVRTGAGSTSASPVGTSAVGSIAAARDRRITAGRIRRTAAALVGVAAVLAGGFLFGDVLLSPSGSDDAAESSAGSAGDSGAVDEDAGAPALADSGTAYTSANLTAEVDQLLASPLVSPDAENAPLPSMSAREPATTGADGADLSAEASRCVDAVSARADNVSQPLAVDIGTFDGLPAVVVVLPLPASADAAAQLWVVSADCLAAEPTDLVVLDRAVLDTVP